MPTISGASFAKSLDPLPGQRRRMQIRGAIDQGQHLPIIWTEIKTRWKGHSATWFVPLDVIRIGNLKDSIRVSMCAQDLAIVAAKFGAILPTFHLLKTAFRVGVAQGLFISPALQQGWDASMRNTKRMVRHSREVDSKIDGRAALVAGNACKHWVLDNRSIDMVKEGEPAAVNAGWWKSSDPNNLWQSPGFHHGITYDDYSQGAWFVRRDCIVDGQIMDVEEVGRDPGLCGLLTGSVDPLLVYTVPGADQPMVPATAPDRPEPLPIAPRNLALGMKGPDVAEWQRELMTGEHDLSPWNDDGDFGRLTHNATIAWQSARSKIVTDERGIVGESTRAAFGSPVDDVDTERPRSIELIQAAHFTRANRSEIRWVILHTMEAREASTTALAVANWFAGRSGAAPHASAHYCIDDTRVIRCVESQHVAWHAPGANRYGIGIEHAGYARQSLAQWEDDFSTKMLKLSAIITAQECQRYNIPIRYVDREGLRNGVRGISTHNEVTWAWRKSSHTDPGKNFPMEHYLDLVREAS